MKSCLLVCVLLCVPLLVSAASIGECQACRLIVEEVHAEQLGWIERLSKAVSAGETITQDIRTDERVGRICQSEAFRKFVSATRQDCESVVRAHRSRLVSALQKQPDINSVFEWSEEVCAYDTSLCDSRDTSSDALLDQCAACLSVMEDLHTSYSILQKQPDTLKRRKAVAWNMLEDHCAQQRLRHPKQQREAVVHVCEMLVDEHESSLVGLLASAELDATEFSSKICVETARLCSKKQYQSRERSPTQLAHEDL